MTNTGNFNFVKDLANAKDTEKYVAKRLCELHGYQIIEKENTNKYDYAFLTKSGKKITVEIKEDLSCNKYHNVAVEFECRGKPSGIAVTKADYYLYVIHTPEGVIRYVWHPVEKLKKMIDKKKYKRIGNGGDPGSNTKMYLFYYKKFINSGTELALDK